MVSLTLKFSGVFGGWLMQWTSSQCWHSLFQPTMTNKKRQHSVFWLELKPAFVIVLDALMACFFWLRDWQKQIVKSQLWRQRSSSVAERRTLASIYKPYVMPRVGSLMCVLGILDLHWTTWLSVLQASNISWNILDFWREAYVSLVTMHTSIQITWQRHLKLATVVKRMTTTFTILRSESVLNVHLVCLSTDGEFFGGPYPMELVYKRQQPWQCAFADSIIIVLTGNLLQKIPSAWTTSTLNVMEVWQQRELLLQCQSQHKACTSDKEVCANCFQQGVHWW